MCLRKLEGVIYFIFCDLVCWDEFWLSKKRFQRVEDFDKEESARSIVRILMFELGKKLFWEVIRDFRFLDDVLFFTLFGFPSLEILVLFSDILFS
jgi:hypothetical protein